MSIREIAKRAKVSIASVSRTINNVPSVDPEIAGRVWRAVRELGYYPNTQARALASGRSRILGLIVSDITNPFFPELIKGFEEVAIPAGFEVLLSSTGYDPDKMKMAVRRMLERKAEGAAIMTSEMEESLITEMTGRSVPLVFVDVGPPAPHVSNIGVNYREGLNQAVHHLLRLGHRRIAFISGPPQIKSAQIRRQAFLECLRNNNMAAGPDLLIQGDHTMEGGLHAAPKILAMNPPATAVLASNDLTAIGLLMGLDREGLRVPADISVVGFDDIHFAQFTIPPLTTIQLSRPELAKRSFQALLADIEKKVNNTHGMSYSVDTRLVVRESTGRAAKERESKATPKKQLVSKASR